MLVELPNKSMVIHKDNCWEEAQWDTYPAPFKTQLWFVPGQLASQHRATSCVATFRQTLSLWDLPQYDFHWHDAPVLRGCNADMRDKACSKLRNRCSSSYHRGSGRGDRHEYSWQQCAH